MEGAAGAARGAVVAGSEYVPDRKFVFESVYRIVPYDVRVERELAVVLCISEADTSSENTPRSAPEARARSRGAASRGAPRACC